MGITKTEHYSQNQLEIAEMFKAIGHPARVAIIEALTNKNDCVCGDLVIEVGLAQATVSQHLKALKNVGLIRGNIDGASVCYCLDVDKIKLLQHNLQQLLTAATRSNECC